ncbi:hypothetical protein BD408DRAFT_419685 [Parasitella parasitica]|nr:hypothetical protein BD408DRAFT_419685 [Parasitella parasitica]
MYRRRIPKVDEKPKIPDNLEEFGYVLKENGELRSNNEADQPYVFDYLPKDKPYNEDRYDKFMELVGDIVEDRLQQEPFNFQKVLVPSGADPAKDVHSYIYMTPNAMTTTGKLMVMIPGISTRIGQWSQRIMCDTNIQSGSMMEISEMVFEKGYEVIILNPNANFWYNGRANMVPQKHTSVVVTVPDSDTPEAHCQYVFHNFVRHAKAEKVAIIANGWGAHGFVLTLNTEFDYIKDHVKAVAMTNSVHMKDAVKGEKERAFVYNNCCNWSASVDKKGTLVPDIRLGCTNIASGEAIADYTLPTMLKDIMNYIFVRMGDIEWESESDDDEPKELTEEDLEVLSQIDVLSTNA